MKKENHQLLAEEVIEKALLKGADFSDVVIFENTSRNISCRLGKVEEISDVLNSIEDLGMKIFINNQNAVSLIKEQLEILNDERIKKSPIKIVVINKEFDVELDLPNSYRVNKDVINSINHIPGVIQVERFDSLISENS